MTDVGRFGVFLPSYIWAGDGPERARGIKEFSRAVEDLGFDSLFITDHMLDIMIPLLEGETVTYHGEFYSVDDLSIEPRSTQRPEIWIGGGSQLADPKSPDLPK